MLLWIKFTLPSIKEGIEEWALDCITKKGKNINKKMNNYKNCYYKLSDILQKKYKNNSRKASEVEKFFERSTKELGNVNEY